MLFGGLGNLLLKLLYGVTEFVLLLEIDQVAIGGSTFGLVITHARILTAPDVLGSSTGARGLTMPPPWPIIAERGPVSLNLNVVTFYEVMQVTDRLISKQDLSPFDKASNKNVIFRATDAVVSVAYSGAAYIGVVPTDQWLAAILSGDRDLASSDFTLRFTGGPRLWPTLATAAIRLRDALTRLPLDVQFLDVTIAGWYQPRANAGARTILWSFTKEVGKATVWDRAPRHYLLPRPTFGGVEGSLARWISGTLNGPRGVNARSLVAAGPSQNVSAQSLREMAEEVREVRTQGDLQEARLVDALRREAGRTPGIGKDCISIVMPPLQLGVRVRYCPSTENTAEVRVGARRLIRPVVYAPWIVSPGVSQAPSAISGGGTTTVDLGGVQVHIFGPTSADGHGLHTMGHQQRPRRP